MLYPHSDLLSRVEREVDRRKDEIISFLQGAVRIPSVSCDEAQIVEFLRGKLVALGFDQAVIDEIGNVYGTVRGTKGGKTLVYNGHVDHVPPGEMEDPYSAKIIDGREFGVRGPVIYGRATADMKSGIVSMIMGAHIASEIAGHLKENLTVTGVVMEDATPGHPGPKYLVEKDGLSGDAAIITESTNLGLNLGHRGSSLIVVRFKGKSAHASEPSRGVNALYHASKFISEFEMIRKSFPRHEVLGYPTAAITDVKVYPGALNVIPERCDVFIDFRYIPEYRMGELIRQIENLISRLKTEDNAVTGEASIVRKHLRSHTGLESETEAVNLPFYTSPSEELVKTSSEVLRGITGKAELGTWTFGTDGAYFASLGIPTIGIGPGEERFAHTVQEHVRVSDLLDATKVYAGINLAFCG